MTIGHVCETWNCDDCDRYYEKMKGNDRLGKQASGMSNKPIITCAGDWNLFCTLEAPLVAAIPQDSSEWRRSFGRVVKQVFIEATFEKFTKDILPGENDWMLMKQPVFHIYWTDCTDVESYKTTTRDDIEAWFKVLAQNNITDWMIVLVETYDIRKTNKLLPRTTVLDKIRSDFASKHGDRCLSVINPIKSESRSAESWRGLVSRLRHLVLTAYNKSLIRFEEHMREQRERRIEPGWNYCEYFLLQEQLAFVLEMLGLYDEALVQYDELDALFTQFVLNSSIGHSPEWLATFQIPIEMWQGINLTPNIPLKRRELLKECKATLIDFRTYLFQRQSAMLLLTCRPWEIANRCLSVVHNTIKEIQLLEINVPVGAFACWALLTCLEVLQTCERLATNASHQVVQQCATHQAPLWHYAKDKLCELGKLCGLLPGTPDPSSAQLHLVLTLSAGMGDMETINTPNASICTTPIDRLKETLGSKQAFQTHYLELAELAMGTYKHIGRLRCARLIGRDLASFYSELGETGKACVFLLDALRSYEEQGWKDLAAQTRMELVSCYHKMADNEKYTKLSATISCTLELEILVRNFYFDEMMKSIKHKLADTKQTIIAELGECFKVVAVEVLPSERESHIKDNPVRVCLCVESFFPREVVCRRAAISLETVRDHDPAKKGDKKLQEKGNKTDLVQINNVGAAQAASSPVKKGNLPVGNSTEVPDFVSSCRLDDLKPRNPLMCSLKMSLHLDWKEDKTLDTASVQCNNAKAKLKRTDSYKYRKQSATTRSDYTHSISLDNFSIKPGMNDIFLETIAHEAGLFRLGQISLVVEEKLEYLSNGLTASRVCYEVVTQGLNVALNKVDPKKDLLAGIEHAMELVVTSGSINIAQNCSIQLKTSNGLTVKLANSNYHNLVRELDISIPQCQPFNTVNVPLIVFAHLPPKKDDKPIEHKVYLQCPWWENPVVVALHFSPPISALWRLLTSNTRKIIHITLSTSSDQSGMAVSKPNLQTENKVVLVDLNPKGDQEYILGSTGTTVSFMWEIQMDPLEKPMPIKTMFSMVYRMNGANSSKEPHEYKCPYEMHDYTTLFLVKSKVEPTKGSEFCRASQMCYLQLSVQKVNETDHNSLMYEVLADQTMWAVCGRTAGVITMDNCEPQTVTLDVMPLIAGHLPLPAVRLSKYIAATQQSTTKDGRKPDSMNNSSHPRLEPFSPGQVYHSGKAQQVHVLASTNSSNDQH